LIKARAEVQSVLNSEKLTKEQSINLISDHQDQLQLTDRQYKRWAGKQYLVPISAKELAALAPFALDKSAYSNMDDWLPVGDIKKLFGSDVFIL
jgi:hypothetical protein